MNNGPEIKNMEITYKEFFEKSKQSPFLQQLIGNSFQASINVALTSKEVFPDKPQADAGELMLNALATLAKLEGIILTCRDEVNAEYITDVVNSYNPFHD